MEIPSLGGDRNPYEARRSGEARMEGEEAGLKFEGLRKEFFEQAVARFYKDKELMSALRNQLAFQNLKRNEDFSNFEGWRSVASEVEDLLIARGLEDSEQQAAFLSVIARVDFLQDEQLKEMAEMDND